MISISGRLVRRPNGRINDEAHSIIERFGQTPADELPVSEGNLGSAARDGMEDEDVISTGMRHQRVRSSNLSIRSQNFFQLHVDPSSLLQLTLGFRHGQAGRSRQ